MARRMFTALEGTKENNVVVVNSTWKYTNDSGGLEIVSGDKNTLLATYEYPTGFSSRLSWGSKDQYSAFLGGIIAPQYGGDFMSHDADNMVQGIVWASLLDPAAVAANYGFEDYRCMIAFQWLKVADGTPPVAGDFWDSGDSKGMGIKLSLWFRNSNY